jgi:hypothetical protein
MFRADSQSVPPVIAALHDARSALTVVSGRVSLAQLHAARGADPRRLSEDLRPVAEHLARAIAAVNALADAAIAQGLLPSSGGDGELQPR